MFKLDLDLLVKFTGYSRILPTSEIFKKDYLIHFWLLQVCGASDKDELPPRFIKLARDVYTPDLIAASDCMLGQYWDFWKFWKLCKA